MVFEAIGNQIGAQHPARNIISGNARFGVSLQSGSEKTKVQGNYVGTDVTGTIALGNVLGGD